MTARSGLAASVGFGEESTWGIDVAPTVHIPLTDETIGEETGRLESEGIIPGARLIRSQQWAEGDIKAMGDVKADLSNLSKGLLLKHMFGGSSSTGPFSPADMGGLGLSVQVGVPDTTDGTVRPKTLAGGKVTSWEIACKKGEIATMALSFAGRHVVGHRTVADGATTNTSTTVTSATAGFCANDIGKPIAGTGIPAATTIASVESTTSATLSAAATATATGLTFTFGRALTSPSLASGIAPMTYRGTTVLMAGAAADVEEISIAGDNGYDVERLFLGAGTIKEPLEENLRVYDGTIKTEYFNDTMYRRFIAGTETALVTTIARGTMSIVFTMNVRYDGESPKVAGRKRVGISLPYKCIGTTTDAAGITVTLDET